MTPEKFETDIEAYVKSGQKSVEASLSKRLPGLCLVIVLLGLLSVAVISGIIGHVYSDWFTLVLVLTWGATIWVVRQQLSELVYFVFVGVIESLLIRLGEYQAIVESLEQELQTLQQSQPETTNVL